MKSKSSVFPQCLNPKQRRPQPSRRSRSHGRTSHLAQESRSSKSRPWDSRSKCSRHTWRQTKAKVSLLRSRTSCKPRDRPAFGADCSRGPGSKLPQRALYSHLSTIGTLHTLIHRCFYSSVLSSNIAVKHHSVSPNQLQGSSVVWVVGLPKRIQPWGSVLLC